MRTNYAMIKIAEGTVLSKSGDGHVLCYSKAGDYYYSVSLADLLKNTNDSIAKLKEESETFDAEMKETYDAKIAEIDGKIASMDAADDARDAKVEEMIENYKESMAKVIAMVEQLVGTTAEEDNTAAGGEEETENA